MAAPHMPPPPQRASQQPPAEPPLAPPPSWPAPFVRSEDITYAPLDETPLARGLAVVGVSGIGNAGSLAARYLIKHLDMKLVGTFQSEHFPPAAASHRGLMAGTLQVWADESPCGPHEECERLLVVKNDLPIDMAMVAPLSTAIARWASRHDVSLLVGIDSYPRGAEEPDRVLAGASATGRDLIAGLDADPLDDAIVVGFNAGLVTTANQEHVRALALYGPRTSAAEDGKAAAAALRAASRLLPRLDLDGGRVSEELDRLEKELERQVEAAMAGGRAERGFRGYA